MHGHTGLGLQYTSTSSLFLQDFKYLANITQVTNRE